jgi:hypothetical protein
VESWLDIGILSSGDDILNFKLEFMGWMLLDCVIVGGNNQLLNLARFIFVLGDDCAWSFNDLLTINATTPSLVDLNLES